MLSLALVNGIPERFIPYLATGEPFDVEEELESIKQMGLFLKTRELSLEYFEGSRFCNLFANNIMEQNYLEQNLKTQLVKWRVPLLLIILGDLVEDLNIKAPPQDTFNTRRFLRAWQRNLRINLDTDIRKNIMTDIAEFYDCLLNAAAAYGEMVYAKLLDDIGPFPSYLLEIFKRRLLFVCIHPNQQQTQYRLQNIQTPKLNLVGNQFNKKRRWTPEEFAEVFVRLPLDAKCDFITEFDRKLWKGHLFSKHMFFKIDCEFSNRELLGQILCFLLPNWFSIWPTFFPLSYEIQCRLMEMKKQNWQPDVGKFMKLLIP